jgi:hypothetical protein
VTHRLGGRSGAQAVEQGEQRPLDLGAGRARVAGARDEQRRLGERGQQQVRQRADVGADDLSRVVELVASLSAAVPAR